MCGSVPVYMCGFVPVYMCGFVPVYMCGFVPVYMCGFVPHFSFFWCLGKAELRDCGICWVTSIIFLIKMVEVFKMVLTSFVWIKVQSNLNGSNIFGPMEIRSRHG